LSKFKTSNKCKLFQKERKGKFEIFLLRLSYSVFFIMKPIFIVFSIILYGLTI